MKNPNVVYFCISIVFIHVIGTDLVKHDPKNIIDHNEAMFAGVIKNISRVNNVLQELINNYEHLQKIYKSQENLENASSDGEIDEEYKNKNKKEQQATVKHPSDNFPATQPIWDEEEIETNHTESKESKMTKTEKPQQSAFTNNYNGKVIIDLNKMPKEPATPKAVKLVESQTATVVIKTTTSDDRSKHIIEPGIVITVTEKVKTRYNKISHSQPGSDGKHKKKSHLKPPEPKAVNETNSDESIKMESKTSAPRKKPKKVKRLRKVDKKPPSSSISPKNIWDEIINSKPRQLETKNAVVIEKRRKVYSRLPQLRTEKTALAVVIKDKNRTKSLKNEITDIFNNDDDDDETSKDDFQATVLREAYEDACLKVVIKKCFKACKEAGKVICQRYKCKTSYKNKYMQLSKRGCILEFDRNCTGDNCIVENNNSSVIQSNTRFAFGDVTRDTYLRDCLPHIQSDTKSLAIPKKKVPTNDSQALKIVPIRKDFSVLRSDYEKACQKISKEKCRSACHYAYRNVCETFVCAKERKKAYRKACKNKCNKSYGDSGSSSSGSSSSGSDSSNSDSDDSDSDFS